MRLLVDITLEKDEGLLKTVTTHVDFLRAYRFPETANANESVVVHLEADTELGFVRTRASSHLIHPSIHPASQPASQPAIQPASQPSIHPSIHPSIYLSIYLSVYASTDSI